VLAGDFDEDEGLPKARALVWRGAATEAIFVVID
jgi:hypothetical protein